jgi:hypothetical protein
LQILYGHLKDVGEAMEPARGSTYLKLSPGSLQPLQATFRIPLSHLRLQSHLTIYLSVFIPT